MFWDPILSGNKDVACATCHHPRFGYAENGDLSIGVNGLGLGRERRFNAPGIPFVKRNSQTILNAAFNGIDQSSEYDPETAPMFWDLRAKSLETQSLEPIKAFEEMRGNAYAEDKIIDEVVTGGRIQWPESTVHGCTGFSIIANIRMVLGKDPRPELLAMQCRHAQSPNTCHSYPVLKQFGPVWPTCR